MPVTLPTAPAYRKARMEPIENSVIQRVPLGGIGPRVRRLGDHWALSVEYPPIQEGDQLAALLATIVAARADIAQHPVPQPRVSVAGSYGALVVNGANQTGGLLNVTGGTAGLVVKAGQFFSVSAGGRSYLYMVMADRLIDAAFGGGTQFPIWPMLRRSPDNGAAINLVSPVIEGLLTDNFDWEYDPTVWVAGLRWRIEERG